MAAGDITKLMLGNLPALSVLVEAEMRQYLSPAEARAETVQFLAQLPDLLAGEHQLQSSELVYRATRWIPMWFFLKDTSLTLLPIDVGRTADTYAARDSFDALSSLRSLGFEIIGTDNAAPTMLQVRLPEGWKKVKSAGPINCSILDKRNRTRAHIIYDTKPGSLPISKLTLVCRFGPQVGRADEEADRLEDRYVGGIIDSATTIPEMLRVGDTTADYDEAKLSATSWLNKHKPQWFDPAAYWDDPHDVVPDASGL